MANTIVMLLSLFTCGIAIVHTATPTHGKFPQPKASHGYECVRRNHQLFCPKPPSVHHQPGSTTFQQANGPGATLGKKSVNYKSPSTISPQSSARSSDNNNNNNNKQQPCYNCDRSSSQRKVNSRQTTATSHPEHVPSFYAYLPHHVSTKHEHDAHEHLIVDVAHDRLYNEFETLHEAPIFHRVKRDEIHEFIQENRALMKRMFGSEAPPPLDDEIVYNRNTLYPMSNYAYATDFNDGVQVETAASMAKSTGASLHDHTNNHYGDNYSGQHIRDGNNNSRSSSNSNSNNNNNNNNDSNNYYVADETRSLLSTVQHGNNSMAQSRKRMVTSNSGLASASQGSSNSTSNAMVDHNGRNRNRKLNNANSVYQQYKQQRTGRSTIGRNSGSWNHTVQDHDDHVSNVSGQVRQKRSSRTSTVVANANGRDLFAQRVDSCESHLEVVTPYWATNSHGHVRAIVNSQHMQQAIQQEICKTTSTVRCNGECSCEQKYKWHRMLAYDPEENCKGIFMDWFLFPSNCVCRCIVKPPPALIGQPTTTPVSTRNSVELTSSSR